MLRILLGNSPPATKTNKDKRPIFNTIAFDQFLEAKKRFKPDYFLLYGNPIPSKDIRAHIKHSLGVDFQYINSGLLSAQSHRQFYAHNIPDVPLPQDKEMMVKDILSREHNEKNYALQSGKYYPKPNKNLPIGIVRLGTAVNGGKNKHDSRPYRVYSPYGKATSIMGNAGGAGGKTGLYACPVNPNVSNDENVIMSVNRKYAQIYDSSDGTTNITALRQNIELPDGIYVIRKLSINECFKMMGFTEGFNIPCSNNKAYKLLSNTVNVDVLAHILGHIPNIRHETIEVLSIYDGVAQGYIALNKLSANIISYYAAETDETAIQTADANFAGIHRTGNMDDIESDDYWNNTTPVTP